MRPLLALTISTVLLATPGCGRAVAGQVARQQQAMPTHQDLPYVKGGHERQKLDLYLPTKREGKLPLVVWVHGGGWKGGSKSRCPARFLVPRGYAVASVGYRLSPDAKFPAQIEDCRAAIRWLRAHADEYGIDGSRIGVWGGSAGGHLVSLLGTTAEMKKFDRGENLTTSARVQAVVDWFGPADLTAGARFGQEAISALLGGQGSAVQELAREASPLLHATKDDAPFLIIHGDKDPLVPIEQSRRFAEGLQKAKVPVTLVVLNGAGHGGPQFLTAEELDRIDGFFAEYLKPQKGASQTKEKRDW